MPKQKSAFSGINLFLIFFVVLALFISLFAVLFFFSNKQSSKTISLNPSNPIEINVLEADPNVRVLGESTVTGQDGKNYKVVQYEKDINFVEFFNTNTVVQKISSTSWVIISLLVISLAGKVYLANKLLD